jgi:hypothetical protein
LFKGNKTKMAPQQTPQQLALMQYLSQLGKQNIGQGAANKQPTYDAMNMISRMFGGGMGQYGQQQQQGAANPMVSQIFSKPQRV